LPDEADCRHDDEPRSDSASSTRTPRGLPILGRPRGLIGAFSFDNVRKFLIVTADDFGLHSAVNEAVELGCRDGILTSASLMVAAPAAADAVRRARELPQLRVGLHLVLADGYAVLQHERIPALVNAQGRFGNRMFVDGMRFFALPAVRRQLEAEIRAQYEAFASTGLALDHVNAHKHFHLHPTVLEMLVRIGREYGLRAGLAGVRVPDEPLRGASVATILLRPWLALMKRRLRAYGIAYSDHVFGLGASGRMDEDRLLQILARLPRGVTEIYLHPATQSGSAIAASMEGYRHADELSALTSPKVRATLAAMLAADVSCGGYRDLSRRIGQRHAA
jgi:hopanoid biosynthesis associated protein HpnK